MKKIILLLLIACFAVTGVAQAKGHTRHKSCGKNRERCQPPNSNQKIERLEAIMALHGHSILTYAGTYNVSAKRLLAIVTHENGGKTKSPNGIAHITASARKATGASCTISNADCSIKTAAQYLQKLKSIFPNSEDLQTRAYNAGEGCILTGVCHGKTIGAGKPYVVIINSYIALITPDILNQTTETSKSTEKPKTVASL